MVTEYFIEPFQGCEEQPDIDAGPVCGVDIRDPNAKSIGPPCNPALTDLGQVFANQIANFARLAQHPPLVCRGDDVLACPVGEQDDFAQVCIRGTRRKHGQHLGPENSKRDFGQSIRLDDLQRKLAARHRSNAELRTLQFEVFRARRRRFKWHPRIMPILMRWRHIVQRL